MGSLIKFYCTSIFPKYYKAKSYFENNISQIVIVALMANLQDLNIISFILA